MASSTSDPHDLSARIAGELASLVAIRHDLHAHPELGYQERRTSGVIVRELTSLGIAHRAGLAGGTGVVAHIPATEQTSRKSVALRADMDALPITEETGVEYASTNPGVMHACGHDGHTTILLGAARVLSRLPHRPRPVTLLFQPAEEGGAGAKKLCEDGCLEGVEKVFGLHGWPELPLGVLATRPGPLLAATDAIDTTIHGSQAHAAFPHMGHDPIVAAAHVVTALQSVASRNVSPLDSVVVTIGMLHAGSARNVIPATATLAGTIRTLRPETRVLARKRVKEIAEQVSAAMGCRAEVRLEEGYPATVNHAGATDEFFRVAKACFGESRVRGVDEPVMGGEDFSFYAQRVPACFFMLGVRPDGATGYPSLHQPTYNFNDDAIGTGVEMMCRLALET